MDAKESFGYLKEQQKKEGWSGENIPDWDFKDGDVDSLFDDKDKKEPSKKEDKIEKSEENNILTKIKKWL